MQWSDAQFQTLKGLVDRGLSASQIGAELGVSRNAVIGKVHRGGLLFSRGRGAVVCVAKSSPTKRRPRGRHVVKIHNGGTRRAPGLAELPPENPALAVTLAELTPAHCRWPVGTVDAMLYCGAAQAPGSSYCVRHDFLAHRGGAA